MRVRGLTPLLRASVVLLLGVSPACSQKDTEKCDQGLQVTRQALASENFAAAAQWREFAWKHCEDRGSVEGLDREVVAKRGEVEARNRAMAERRRANLELLKTFLGWVAMHRGAADRASANPSCDPPAPSDPRKDQSKERLCSATRLAGTYQLMARYWAADPSLSRFNVKLPDVTSCEEIGASRVLKTWQVAATQGRSTARFRCEFTSGPLAGMHAVLSQAVNADLYVFNPGYLDKEPALRSLLEGP